MNGATTIQERLKDLRLNKGLKLEELAEQTGISKSALGSYEKDDYKEINHGNLILLADFYGVSLDYLFCRTENRAEINTPLRELHLSDEMVALLKSGRINNRLLCKLATHKDFIKFLADIEIYVDRLSGRSWKFPFLNNSAGRWHFLLSPLDCLPAKAGGAVNGCAYAPFILTVDWLGWVCYLPDKLEFILSYHVLPS